MAKSFLDYFKTLLPNFSFDNSLLMKEYIKALTLLSPNEQISLTNWLTKKGLKLQPIKIN
tara:strand:+ start:371 stop:550 length:180 start_codon:yes stop_codon:yes gene_type:complete